MLILCSCQQVFFKMDAHGNGQEVVLDHVFSCDTRVPSFRHFNKDLFTGYSQFLTSTHLHWEPKLEHLEVAIPYYQLSLQGTLATDNDDDQLPLFLKSMEAN